MTGRFVRSRLLNGQTGDPALFLDCATDGWALLFDLGDLSALTARDATRITHVFVSHTHLDHFAGFDRLLRWQLERDHSLLMFGPAGFCAQVAARLRSYTWNLLNERSPDFSIIATELSESGATARCRFAARRSFAAEPQEPDALAPGLAHANAAFQVAYRVLDHGIASLGYAVTQSPRIHAVAAAMKVLDLKPGPWIEDVKRRLRSGAPDGEPVNVGDRMLALGTLRAEAFRITPGEKIAYATDLADTLTNRTRLIELARDANLLFVDAAFAEADRDLALRKRHLTTRAAGEIARAAGVGSIVPMHFSARYAGQERDLIDACQAAFEGRG